MRSFWSEMPLLRIAIALMAGIGLALAVGGSDLSLFVACSLMVASLTSAFTINRLKDTTRAFSLRWLNGASLVSIIISTGFLLTRLNALNNYATHFSHFLQPKNVLQVTIDEPPVERAKVYMATAQVSEVLNDSIPLKTTGYIQLTFLKDSLSSSLKYGDVLLLKSRVDTLDEPKNPLEFSFKRYQGFHNIYQKSFVLKSDWQRTDSLRGNTFFSAIYFIRNNFLQILKKYVPDKNDFEVASAIMLGYNDYDKNIKRAYAASGTLHVLSVSGLHVGIMFLMLNFLLKGLSGRGKRLEITKALIIILFIWFYACLTGMSPPVMRSAMMFTLIQIGTVMARNVNIYNIIAGSAVLQLLFDPFVIADVGFELSYIAVVGIIYLYPKVSELLVIKLPQQAQFKKQKGFLSKAKSFFRNDLRWAPSWCLNWLWQLIAVSIAAQIAILPLSLLYFYQFPNLFLISNLIVIPLSNLVLFCGTALFAVGHIPHLGDWTGWLFNQLLIGLDSYIFWVAKLPVSLTRGLSIGPAEMILMYLLIFLLCWFMIKPKAKTIIASLCTILLLCSFNSYRAVQNNLRKELVVYSVPKQKAIAFISGKNLIYDFDNSLWNNPDDMALHIWHHWSDCGINHEVALEDSPTSFQQLSFGKYVVFEGKPILIIDSTASNFKLNSPEKLNVEIVILSGNPKLRIEDLTKACSFRKLIFDSSNKYRTTKHWKADCETLHINYYDVTEKGAFIQDFD